MAEPSNTLHLLAVTVISTRYATNANKKGRLEFYLMLGATRDSETKAVEDARSEFPLLPTTWHLDTVAIFSAPNTLIGL